MKIVDNHVHTHFSIDAKDTMEDVIKRAIDRNLVEINIHNIRDYTVYSNNQVDDYPFGGGGGMVLMCDPIFRAVEALNNDDAFVIMMTPSGKVYIG